MWPSETVLDLDELALGILSPLSQGGFQVRLEFEPVAHEPFGDYMSTLI
ncbi:hypothetical protein NT26_1042 [Pseudorhizobium banfieldiae]|uniref:Uncharacterized protein n=1 Tax=Pseudorhizobium banfieldiae TaxID=1125847 RepID=L0ND83_9HYPH|nr:hypothetical protein NT26_1042 [Pseudorhizobium banfieldiae]